MSTTTTNYGLIKPDTTDPILIGQLNDNADAIDAALKENADAIENKPDAADIPTPSTVAPAMDGTAAAGTSTDYARADHIHPSDTSKASATSEAEDRAALVELVDGGAKNLFNPSNYTVGSANGVTVTPNGDGTYTLSGAASEGTADFLFTKPNVYTNMYGLKAGGTYTIVSGDDKVLIRIDATTNPSSQWNKNLVTNVANKATFTIPDNIVGLWIRIRVPITSGNVDNVIVTPMICTKAAWDISHEYQPYRPSYQELYEMVKALQANQ